MDAWEPQIRTNLDHPVYYDQLDKALQRTPGMTGAGLVNLRFGEGCYRLAGGESASEEELEGAIALTVGLFGGDEFPASAGYAAAREAMGAAESAYLVFREEAILMQRLGSAGRTLVLTVSSRLNLGACTALVEVISREMGDSNDAVKLATTLERQNDVLAAVILEDGSGEIVARYDRQGEPSMLALDDVFVATITALTAGSAQSGLWFRYRTGEPIRFENVEIATSNESFYWARVPFDPEHLVFLRADRRAVRALLWLALRNTRTETLRMWVDGLLEYGIPSTMEPFPKTQSEFLAIVSELGQMDENDLLGKLDIGGFANYTIGEGDEMQRCQECIYYLPNGKWCDLPELPIPVEPHWWCRLWKM